MKSQIVGAISLLAVMLLGPPAYAADGHADASGGAGLRVSAVAIYRGGTFRMQSTCPEPSRSARLRSGLFASPALLPARLSQQVTWTVNVSPHQRPGSYVISLNCFQLLTGRVTAAAAIRVDVLGSLLRAVSRQHRAGHELSSDHRSRKARAA